MPKAFLYTEYSLLEEDLIVPSLINFFIGSLFIHEEAPNGTHRLHHVSTKVHLSQLNNVCTKVRINFVLKYTLTTYWENPII
jgi:hypothetical protein